MMDLRANVELTLKALKEKLDEQSAPISLGFEGTVEEFATHCKSKEKSTKAVSITLEIDDQGNPLDSDFKWRYDRQGNGRQLSLNTGYGIIDSRVFKQESTGKNYLQYEYYKFYQDADENIYYKLSHYGNEFYEVNHLAHEKMVWVVVEE
jgi:hypothetical protein